MNKLIRIAIQIFTITAILLSLWGCADVDSNPCGYEVCICEEIDFELSMPTQFEISFGGTTLSWRTDSRASINSIYVSHNGGEFIFITAINVILTEPWFDDDGTDEMGGTFLPEGDEVFLSVLGLKQGVNVVRVISRRENIESAPGEYNIIVNQDKTEQLLKPSNIRLSVNALYLLQDNRGVVRSEVRRPNQNDFSFFGIARAMDDSLESRIVFHPSWLALGRNELRIMTWASVRLIEGNLEGFTHAPNLYIVLYKNEVGNILLGDIISYG